MYLWASLLVVFLSFFPVAWSLKRLRSSQFFPGPASLPIVGNLFQVPSKQPWLTYAQWGKRWGSLIHLEVFKKHILIINDVDDVVELLNNRSRNTSDRPQIHPDSIAQRGYDSALRARRKLLHQALNAKALLEYRDMEQKQTATYLRDLLNDPQHFVKHARRAVGSTFIGVTYGYSVLTQDDPWIALTEEVNWLFSITSQSGRHWSDSFPFLSKFPAWVPGAKFRHNVKRMQKLGSTLRNGLLEVVELNRAQGTARHSFVSTLLDQAETDPEKDDEREANIKVAAGGLFGAGSDTSISLIASFFLAMLHNPESQSVAQAELDRVMGKDRVPTLGDRSKLPYMDCIIKETLRWNPVLPLGLAHASTEDDIYKGKLIPAGSTILPNIWNILHDPQIYPDPFPFRPERFLSDSPPIDPREFAFGFGRRRCPGVDLADDILFVIIASTLALFNIRPLKDGNQDLIPELRYTSGMISHPEPFACSITPRQHAISLIAQNYATYNDGGI